MKRNLLIMRHALTKPSHKNGDYHRELELRGEEDALKMGKWLSIEDIIPQTILTSSAKRALTTTLQCCAGLKIQTDNITQLRSLYNASPIDLVSAISEISNQHGTALLVAHNPGVSMLVGQMTQKFISMHPGTLVYLEFEGNWTEFSSQPSRVIKSVNAHELP